MLTHQLRNDIDTLWEKFWTSGITNPLIVIEQLSYLMFSRLLDMKEMQSEHIDNQTGIKVNSLFPDTPEGQLLRWHKFKKMPGKELFSHLKNEVYPYFSHVELEGSDITRFMTDADLEIPNEALLISVIEMVDKLPLGSSDIKGDIYEYLLDKLTTAGINAQFRTPRYITNMMVELLEIEPTDTICDPACGTAGFLSSTMEYLTRNYSSSEDEGGRYKDEDGNWVYTGNLLAPYYEHINRDMFWGFDFDSTMLRLSAMNMMLHGVNGAKFTYQDSLNKTFMKKRQEQNFFDKVLSNPPFKGSIDEESLNPNILKIVKSKRVELLFVALTLSMLKPGGRSATIVPDSFLFGSSKAHQQLRKHLVDDNQLNAVISLPPGAFKPYADVSTSILIFTKGGSTDNVFFYDLFVGDKHDKVDNNDVLTQWKRFKVLSQESDITTFESEFEDKTEQAFAVAAEDIRTKNYDLSVNGYKEFINEEIRFESPKEILSKLTALENEILKGLKELKDML